MVRFGQLFCKMILSTDEPENMLSKKTISSGRWSKTQNGDQNRIYPLG